MLYCMYSGQPSADSQTEIISPVSVSSGKVKLSRSGWMFGGEVVS